MGFTNNLKKSLGFDEEYDSSFNLRNTLGLEESGFGIKRNVGYEEEYNPGYNQGYGLNLASEFDDTYLEDFTISPEQPFYEIVLIKPKSMDDMDYVFDQIVEEGNPVILDLVFLQKKGVNEYKQAASRLKILRNQYNAQVILLSKTSDKNLILVSPSRVKISNKD